MEKDAKLATAIKMAKQAEKKNAYHFAFFVKESDTLLLCSRQKISEKEIGKAKMSTADGMNVKGGAVYRGRCYGEEDQLVFECRKAPPAKVASTLKKAIAKHAGVTIGVDARAMSKEFAAEDEGEFEEDSEEIPSDKPKKGEEVGKKATEKPSGKKEISKPTDETTEGGGEEESEDKVEPSKSKPTRTTPVKKADAGVFTRKLVSLKPLIDAMKDQPVWQIEKMNAKLAAIKQAGKDQEFDKGLGLLAEFEEKLKDVARQIKDAKENAPEQKKGPPPPPGNPPKVRDLQKVFAEKAKPIKGEVKEVNRIAEELALDGDTDKLAEDIAAAFTSALKYAERGEFSGGMVQLNATESKVRRFHEAVYKGKFKKRATEAETKDNKAPTSEVNDAPTSQSTEATRPSSSRDEKIRDHSPDEREQDEAEDQAKRDRQMEKEYRNRLREIEAEYRSFSKSPMGQKLNVAASMKRAIVAAQSGDYAKGLKALDELQHKMVAFYTSEGDAAVDIMEAAGRVNVVQLQKSRLALVKSRQLARAELGRFQAAVLADPDTKSQSDLPEIESAVKKLSSLLDDFDTRLEDTLDLALTESDLKKKRELEGKARALCGEYRSKLAEDDLIADLDDTPFGAFKVFGPMNESLKFLATALKA